MKVPAVCRCRTFRCADSDLRTRGHLHHLLHRGHLHHAARATRETRPQRARPTSVTSGKDAETRKKRRSKRSIPQGFLSGKLSCWHHAGRSVESQGPLSPETMKLQTLTNHVLPGSSTGACHVVSCRVGLLLCFPHRITPACLLSRIALSINIMLHRHIMIMPVVSQRCIYVYATKRNCMYAKTYTIVMMCYVVLHGVTRDIKYCVTPTCIARCEFTEFPHAAEISPCVVSCV